MYDNLKSRNSGVNYRVTVDYIISLARDDHLYGKDICLIPRTVSYFIPFSATVFTRATEYIGKVWLSSRNPTPPRTLRLVLLLDNNKAVRARLEWGLVVGVRSTFTYYST